MTNQRHPDLGMHSAEASASGTPPPRPRRALLLRRSKYIAAGIVLVLVLGAITRAIFRTVQAHALTTATAEHALQYVETIHASVAELHTLTLPGTLQGLIESPIYARSSGYLVRWTKDIGSRVNKGELLAEIDTPEVEQQLSQAVAARQQAASSLELAKSSAERWESMRKKDVVTQQELDERRSAYAQAQANLAAADANVRRLQQLHGFRKVVAPFTGVVTRRNVDVGDLIDAGNGGAGRALFSMVQDDPLRIYVYVPQAYAQHIKTGDPVKVTQNELPGQVFNGTIAHTAGAIDTATRTMQIEIRLPNHNGKLLAGAYVQVALPINGTADALLAPSNVLLFRPEGTRVAVVDDSSHVRLHTVTVGRDFGDKLEILSGITVNDQLVLNPPDSLGDNDAVKIAPPQQPGAAPKKP